MANTTLEDVVQRLDRLEKMITEVNQQLSWIVEVVVPNDSENCETLVTNKNRTWDDKQDNNIGVKVIEEILKRMGYPPDFDPGSIEELRESMRKHGIRAEDNEFSRAIIAEREK